MKKSRGIVLTVLAVVITLVMVNCSNSPVATSIKESDSPGGRSIALSIGDLSTARLLDVNEYEVTSVEVEIYNPDGSFLWDTEWLPSMGARSYSIQVGQLGTYEIVVVHNSDDDTGPISAEERSDFAIIEMMITVIDLTPGAIGLLRIDADTAVSGVAVEPEEVELMVDETEQLAATVTPPEATDPSVSWSSSDEDVALVDEDGLVTAIGRGTATIRVESNSSSHFAECEVTVMSKPLDAFIVSYGAPKYVWANDGSAGFSLAQTLNPAIYGQDVVLGDLDNDGDLDAYVAILGRDEVWMNNGGTFVLKSQPSPLPPALAGAASYGVALGFIDGDDYLDAVTAYRSGYCYYMKGDGDGTFTYVQAISTGLTTWDAELGDLDGDGDLDLMVAGYPYGRYYVNNGSGFVYAGTLPRGGIDRQDVKLEDFDGDGDLDAFFPAYNHPSSEVFINRTAITTPASTISFSGPVLFGRYTTTTRLAVGYINTDSYPDVVLCNIGYPAEVWYGNGSGGFSSSVVLSFTLYARDVALGDLDDDGDVDAFFALRDGRPDIVALNDGTGTLTDSGQRIGSSRAYAVALGPLFH